MAQAKSDLREQLLYDTLQAFWRLYTGTPWLPVDVLSAELAKSPKWAKHRGGLTSRMLVGYLLDLDISVERARWLDGRTHSGYRHEYLTREWQNLQAEKR